MVITPYRNMNLLDRVQQLIKHKNISKRKFDEKISQSDGYISKQIRNNGSIGSDVLEKICHTFPDINPVWLVTGGEEMTRTRGYDVSAAIEKVDDPQAIYAILESKNREIELLRELVAIKEKVIQQYEKNNNGRT